MVSLYPKVGAVTYRSLSLMANLFSGALVVGNAWYDICRITFEPDFNYFQGHLAGLDHIPRPRCLQTRTVPQRRWKLA
jgi:hypothetical protein